MTIKFKLLGGGIAVGLMLVVVLVLTIYSFSNLSNGFTDIVSKSDIGVTNAQSTEASINKADTSLSNVSKSMLDIADQINKTNMTMKVLERKIKQLAETQAELAEELGSVVDELPDGIARDTVEDAVDSVGDIEETMRREALVSLSSTVTKMASFTENIGARVNDMKLLTEELNQGSKLSSNVVSANKDIRTLSTDFGGNISVSRNMIVVVLVIVLLMTSVSVVLLVRAITIPLNRSIDIADGIAKGDLNQTVDTSSKDEFGQLAQSMATMIANLKTDIEETRTRAMEATRIRLALDVCRTNVLMADTDQNIIYMNDSAKKTFADAEQDLQNQLPNFSTENMIGSDITTIHPNPAERLDCLQNLEQETHEDILLGGHSLRTYTNPVFSEEGEKLGIAMEFADRTEEVSVEKELAYIASAASNGDLAERVELSNKEGFFLTLGENMNQLLDVVSDAFNNIATTMETMSKGDLSKKITTDYDGTYAVVKDAQQQAVAGGSVVGEAITAMTEIHDSSDKITEIIAVIDEIAFQTNLLALNASVEAARAGEHGRGFAVVASEVRNLAQRSAEAAKEIKGLISDSEKKVQAGVDLVNRSGETLESITGAIKEVGDFVSEIALTSIEQSSGLEQVNTALKTMDDSTQQNAALAEETSAASESMSEQVENMETTLKFFARV